MNEKAANLPKTESGQAAGTSHFLNEADFLAQEEAKAKAALAAVFGDLKGSMATAVDPRLWTRHHPWIAVGAATAAGFAAATMLIPNRDETLKHKLSELADKVHHLSAGVKPTAGNAKFGLFSTLAGPLMSMAAAAVQTALAQSMGGQEPAPEAPTPTNGHSEPASAGL